MSSTTPLASPAPSSPLSPPSSSSPTYHAIAWPPLLALPPTTNQNTITKLDLMMLHSRPGLSSPTPKPSAKTYK
ncbi:hypothetical protein MA16_Dca002490 [Dendrobium catenatum]|uniref:Uncharacterized protein n=1 Tax=Dendrobium catenatum TaxID=906689 RepID=A0A2I0W0N2_9ASPA|nr:hypothetical protein MA16_Dca002490 [Dendrobium catenatum]